MFSPNEGIHTARRDRREGPAIALFRFLRASATPWFMLFFLSASSLAQNIHFADIAAQAGIHFTHNNGAFGKKWLPETLGPGCAFIDYDNDGYPDIILSQRRRLSRARRTAGRNYAQALSQQSQRYIYRRYDARQAWLSPCSAWESPWETTTTTGLTTSSSQRSGRVTCFTTMATARLRDVTKSAGMWGPNEFSTSAAWLDYDRDGKLDLVGRELRAVERAGRSLLHARRRAQVVLHTRVVQGHVAASVAQPGRRQFEDATAEGRAGRSHLEEPGHRGSRLQRRWLARPA